MAVNKCSVTNEDVKNIKLYFENLGYEYDGNLVELQDTVTRKLEELRMYDQRQRPMLVNAIMEVVEDWDSLLGTQFFNITNITNIIQESNQGVQRLNANDYGTDRLEKGETAQTRKEVNRDFLNKAFGTAITAKKALETKVLTNMVRSVIINRDNINKDTGERMTGLLVDNLETMNEQLEAYKEQLLETVLKYLKMVNPDIKIDTMFNDKGYTGILEEIRGDINKYLNPTNFTAEIIASTHSFDPNDLQLQAYYAIITLDNFDTWLSLLFKDAVNINTFNIHSKNNYSFSEKLAKLSHTWKVDDEDHVEEHISSFVQAIINTTPMYKKGNLIPNSYMKFNDFGYIISKLKKLTYNYNYHDIKIDSSLITYKSILVDGYYETETVNVLDTLSSRTRFLVEGLTLAQIINKIRTNPQAYLSALFELLSNETFLKIKKSVLFENPRGNKKDALNDRDLDIIYSAYKGLFSLEDKQTSVAAIVLGNVMAPNNYYEYIAQVADSIFAVDFIQYFTEDEYELKARTLHSLSIDNIRRDLEQQIQISKTRLTKKPYDESNIVEVKSFENAKIKNITFSIPNTSIQVTIATTTGKATYLKNNAYIKPESIFDELLPFIQELLSINLDLDMLTALSDLFTTASEMRSKLVDFASRVFMIDYINHKHEAMVDETTGDPIFDIKTLKNNASAIFGDNVKVNYQLSELSLIHKSDVDTLIALAEAKGILQGLERSSIVRTSEGDALGTITNSRLTGAMHSLFEEQCKLDHSVTKDCLLLRNPGIFKGIFTTKEFKYDRRSKAHTDFSTAEFAYAHTVTDFLQGFVKKKYTSSPMGDGIIGLIPSVNSDKSTISRILIDLNQKVLTRLGEKALKDLDDLEMLELIDSEFATIYRNTFNNIQNDLNKILLNLNNILIEIDKTDHPLFGLSFTELLLDDFETFNKVCRDKGLVPYDALMDIVNLYNQRHKKDPIVFTDLVHYINNGGNLKTNPSLLGLLYRHNAMNIPEKLVERYNLIRSNQFFDIKHKEVLKSLLESGFELNVYANESTEFLYVLREFGNWIDDAGDLILAQVNYKGTVYNISNLSELKKIDPSASIDLILVNSVVELNPIHKKMNLLDSLFTQQFMDMTVGSFIAHPAKVKNADFLTDAAARFQALHKRNVSMTASMHEFLLNSMKGIPMQYNIAILEDVYDTQAIISGDVEDGIKPWDGATFVNPFVVYLENYSLGGSKAGITKKQFVHFYDEHTGTGGIIKTAGFGLTNDVIRNSPYYQLLMERMTNREWDKDVNGNHLNILKDFNGNDINYFEKLFFKKGSKYYQITGVEYEGNGMYRRTIVEVDSEGAWLSDPKPEELSVFVNSNFKLWELFGGYRSCDLVNGKLEYGENSIKQVVHAINTVGNVVSIDGEVRNGSDVYQPLKHSDIHYVPTVGAVKQGAGNINKNLDGPLNFMKIRMSQSGIQLDKEHHADDSELSLMTLVISACASRGFTKESAQILYEALGNIARINLNEFTKAFDFLNVDNGKAVREVVVKTVIDGLVNALDTTSFIHRVAQDLIEEARNGKALSFNNEKIPVSADEVYSLFVSAVSVFMTNAGIKRKVAGILSVLTPSFGIMKLYNGKKYEQILEEADNLDLSVRDYLELLLKNEAPVVWDMTTKVINKRNILLGRSYRVITQDLNGNIITEVVKIQTPQQRMALIQKIPYTLSVKEDITQGRDLGSYDAFFNENYSINDLRSVNALYELKEIGKGNTLALQQLTLKYFGDARFSSFEEVEKLIRRDVQSDLNKLNINKVGGEVLIINERGEIETVQITSTEVIPYEVVMPKTFATNFGLAKYDQLTDIVNDPEFFTKKLIAQHQTKSLYSTNYDLELKNIRGEHVLIALSLELLREAVDITDSLIIRTDEAGNSFRLDRDGNILHQLKTGDKIFRDGAGNEIIVTSDPTFYLNTMSYYDVKMSPNTLNSVHQTNTILNSLLDCGNKTANNYAKYLKRYDSEGVTMQSLAEAYDADMDKFVEMGAEIYNSFILSLNVVAARIPAQSLQSFMPMRVVAFDNPDINTAYVSTALILLQGSDYDIDAVSLATYVIDNTGRMPLWSPYASLKTLEALKLSLTLPVPTGMNTVPELYDASTEDEPMDEFLNILDNPNIIKLRMHDGSLRLEFSNNIPFIKSVLEWVNSGRFKWPTAATEDLLAFQISGLEGLEYNDLAQIRKQFIDLIDKHNLYLNKMGKHKLEDVINNIVTHSMYSIIENPVNLMEAQSPVDSTVKPLKDKGNESKNAAALKTRSDGNFVNKMESIGDNQVGKKCIGISATGIKGFFGATQYCNWVLEHGTPQQKARLSFNCEINGKKYSLLANINGTTDLTTIPEEFNGDVYAYLNNINEQIEALKQFIVRTEEYEATISDSEAFVSDIEKVNKEINEANDKIKELLLKKLGIKLLEVDQDSDAVLVLSAMLSLATDNAKELKLSQLNALEKTIGMYLYGISVGVPFNEVANILMSDLALTMTQLMLGNAFIGKTKINSLDDVFDYFELGPDLSEYEVEFYDENNKAKDSPVAALSKQLRKALKGLNINRDLDELPMFLSSLSIDEIAKMQYWLKDEYKIENSTNTKEKARHYKLVKEISNYLDNLLLVRTNELVYRDIKQLAKGAADLKDLGQLLGVNKGLKTSSEDLQRLVSNVEEILNNQVARIYRDYKRSSRNKFVKKDERDLQFDLLRFIRDPEYRELQILAYENVAYIKVDPKAGTEYITREKSFVNPLDLIATVPHYFEYIKSLAYADNALKIVSSKYRSVKPIAKTTKEIYKPSDTRRHLKNVLNLVSNFIKLKWRFDKNITINIPKGNLIYSETGESEPSTTNTPIRLGTPTGDLTFKAWMENEVFPNLKKGMLGKKKAPSIATNAFVRALQATYFTNGSDHLEKINTSLNIQMLPSDAVEQEHFDAIVVALNDLSVYKYDEYPIIELLFLYNQIAFDGKLGQKSFTKMLQSFNHLDLISSYYDYVKQVDERGIIDLEDIPEFMRHLYLSQFGSDDSAAEYIYKKNKSTGKSVLMRNAYPSLEEKQEFGASNFLTASVRYVDDSNITVNLSDGMKAVIVPKFGFIKEILYNGEILDFSLENIKIPYKKINGNQDIDIEELNAYIQTKINC